MREDLELEHKCHKPIGQRLSKELPFRSFHADYITQPVRLTATLPPPDGGRRVEVTSRLAFKGAGQSSNLMYRYTISSTRGGVRLKSVDKLI
jgi:hypothetical protein